MARLFNAERGDLVVLSGEVTKVAGGKGAAEGKVQTVTLKGTRYSKSATKEIEAVASVSFWNSQDRDKMLEGKGQLADRIVNAKVRPGSFISVLAGKKEDGSLVGLNFIYSGVLTLRAKEGELTPAGKPVKDMNIISGSVTKAVLDAERGMARITIPTTGMDGETEFHSITIFNSERNPQMAENAVKYLAPYEKDGKKVYRKALFICGENTHFGKPDGDGNSYVAFRYEFIPKTGNKPEEKQDATDPAETQTQTQKQEEEAEENGFLNADETAVGELPWKI